MKTLTANTIGEAFTKSIDLISSWAKGDPPFIWFRGVKDRDLHLQPGACWRTGYEELEPLVDFTQLGASYTDVGNLDNWTTYYLAQHHGNPTRLLDWSESFAASLFFAFDGWDGTTTPCIWLLQPSELNRVFLNWDGVVSPENNPTLEAWLPQSVIQSDKIEKPGRGDAVYDNEWPLAIYPKKTNLSLTAQQGVFTVHGRRKNGLDELIVEKSGATEDIIARIDLVDFDKSTVYSQLATLGLRRAAIYPDIDNFVRQLKELHKWQ